MHLPLTLAAAGAFSWSRVFIELLSFIGYFGAFGALGFRYFVGRGAPPVEVDSPADAQAVTDAIDRANARLGAVASLLLIVAMVLTAVRKGLTTDTGVLQALGGLRDRDYVLVACAAVMAVAFLRAARRPGSGWAIAAVAAVVLVLRNLLAGHWYSLVNPLHIVGASLWLGTLGVIVLIALPMLWRHPAAKSFRATLAAAWIARFSPLALGASALLGITGIVTAWRHVKHVSNLWTTSYGFALDAKLAVVAVIVGLGAANWKRLAPRMGTDAGTTALERSARTELAFAGVVLVLSAILITLPSP